MPMQRTLSIIKPSAVRDNHIGAILARFEAAGLRIVALKMMRLSETRAREFYAIHADKPFFAELITFMSSGPIVAQVLEGVDAVQINRDVMGATNPAEAADGTIRAEFARSITENAVHGSDAADTAAAEIAFFFQYDGIHGG